MLLKAEGYHSHQTLADHATKFVTLFTTEKDLALHGKKAASSPLVDRVTEKLVLRDVKLAVRLAVLLRD